MLQIIKQNKNTRKPQKTKENEKLRRTENNNKIIITATMKKKFAQDKKNYTK